MAVGLHPARRFAAGKANAISVYAIPNTNLGQKYLQLCSAQDAFRGWLGDGKVALWQHFLSPKACAAAGNSTLQTNNSLYVPLQTY